MSLTYPVTLGQIISYQLIYPFNGACQVENDSRWYVYVALGMWANQSDIQSNNVAIIPPYQSRMFQPMIKNGTPAITLVTSNSPFNFAGTIANTPDQLRISEYASPKIITPESGNFFQGLAADYVIIAGGKIQANQNGLFMVDGGGTPALAVMGRAGLTWDVKNTWNQGDVVIGPYFTQGAGLWWDSQNHVLNVNGTINVNGGSGTFVGAVGGTFTPTGPAAFSWASVQVLINNGNIFTVNNGSFSGLTGTQYMSIRVDGSNVVNLSISSALPAYPSVLVGIWVTNSIGTENGSIILNNGAVTIGSGSLKVAQLSALTANMGFLTAGTIQGATYQTDGGTIPNVKINANGIFILADNNGWLQWSHATSGTVGWVTGFGGTNNNIEIHASPNSNVSGNMNLVAHGTNANVKSLLQLLTDPTFANQSAMLVNQDNAGNLNQVGLLGNVARIRGANFSGLIVGGLGRNPSAMLDVAGDIYYTGQLKVLRGTTKMAYAFVPVSAFFVFDSTGSAWNGSARNVGTYRFNMTDVNNALPANTRAVNLAIGMKWGVSGDGTYFYTREFGTTIGILSEHAKVANVTENAFGTQTLDAVNFAFELLIVGTNSLVANVQCTGYFT